MGYVTISTFFGIVRLVCAAFIGFALIALIWLSDRPAARYTKNLACHYKTIFHETGSPSIVTIGTSRALRAITGVNGGGYFSKAYGQDVTWLDLSRSWRGRGQMYRQVTDIVTQREVKVLAVEYFPDSRYYGHYAKTVMSGDIIEDVFISRSSNAYNRSTFALKSLALKYSGFITKPSVDAKEAPLFSFLAPKRKKPRPETLPISKSVDCIKGESGIVPAKLNKWLKDNPQPDPNPKPAWDFDMDEERRNSGYIEKIVAEADKAGVPVIFFYVPLLNEGVVSEDSKAAFTHRFGKTLISMSLEQARGLYETPDNYGDPTHMRYGGRQYYTKWLAGEISKRLKSGEL